MLPYQENRVEIDPTTVPLDTEITLTKQTVIPMVVYGQIPPKQNVDIGSYRGVVNVGIIF